jgi:hypothetical protein
VPTGRGADIILIDDPLKPEEALSDAQRQAANDWFSHTLYSRLNDKRHRAVVNIMQRMHEHDLVDHILAQGGKSCAFGPSPNRTSYTRSRRSSDREPSCAGRPRRCIASASRSTRSTGPAARSANTICRPVSVIPDAPWGDLIKAEWFERYTATEPPETFDRIVQSWDTANESTELSDFSVYTTWGIKGKKLYLLSLLRKRLEYPDLKRGARATDR